MKLHFCIIEKCKCANLGINQISAFTLLKCIVTKKFLSASLQKKAVIYEKYFKDRLVPRPLFAKVAITTCLVAMAFSITRTLCKFA